jgi:hypothetical protein
MSAIFTASEELRRMLRGSPALTSLSMGRDTAKKSPINIEYFRKD